MRHVRLVASVLCLLAGLFTLSAHGASPSAAQALKLKPVQNDVEYSSPAGKDAEACVIKAERIGKVSGWVVRDAGGAALRRFIDTNSDNVVDLWCYFNNGIEVYRDIDADFNGKADQYRWFNTAGTRWGLDTDEDGVIDHWKVISPEEVTAEVVKAVAESDARRFSRLLLTEDELKDLKLTPKHTEQLQKKIKEAKAEFASVASQQRTLNEKSQWLNFGALRPGLAPAGDELGEHDVVVYENVTALVETAGKTSQAQIGTLIQVGRAWRVIDAPKLLGSNDAVASDGGYFFRTPLPAHSDAGPSGGAGAVDDRMQKLLTQLETLDKGGDASDGNRRRAELLEQLAAAAEKPQDKAQWYQQLADTVSAAAQSGSYPEGVEQLKKLYEKLESNAATKSVAAYVKFRYLAADYGVSLQAKNADFPKIQAGWLKNLKQYAADYPESPDAAEAMLQLAIAQEFAGQEDEAKVWYGRIVKEFPASAAAKKAAGSVRRLDSVGKAIELRGTTPSGTTVDLSRLNGRVVLIHYWATWCDPCVADLAKIKELQAKYGADGFSPVGVSLDHSKSTLVEFLNKNRLPWPQVFEPGSLDGRLANEMGILTLPTMILIDKRGRVVNRNIHVSELEAELKKYLR